MDQHRQLSDELIAALESAKSRIVRVDWDQACRLTRSGLVGQAHCRRLDKIKSGVPVVLGRTVDVLHIGDAMLLTPVPEMLKRYHGTKTVRVVDHPIYRLVFAHNPFIDGFADEDSLPEDQQDTAEGELVLAHFHNHWAARAAGCHNLHALLWWIGCPVKFGVRPCLYLTDAERAAAAELLHEVPGPLAMLAPAAVATGNERNPREYPWQHWIDAFVAHGWSVVHCPHHRTGYAGDIRPGQSRVWCADRLYHSCRRFMDLHTRLWFALMERMDLYLGTTSGGSHVAAAFGVPGLIAFRHGFDGDEQLPDGRLRWDCHWQHLWHHGLVYEGPHDDLPPASSPPWHVDGKRVFQVLSTSRSGHHAIAQWLGALLGDAAISSNCNESRPGKQQCWGDLVEGGALVHEHVHRDAWTGDAAMAEAWSRSPNRIYLYENPWASTYTDADRTWPREAWYGPHTERLAVLRDPWNTFASALENELVKSGTETIAESWKRLATAIADGQLPWIDYNRWSSSREYRDEVAERYGLFNRDAGIRHVSRHGRGSSWDKLSYEGNAGEMQTCDRWRRKADDPAWQAVALTPEVMARGRQLWPALAALVESVVRRKETGGG